MRAYSKMKDSIFVPGNISAIFVIKENKDPVKKGSHGVGITVDKGVFVKSHFSSQSKILFNGKKIKFPTVKYVVDNLYNKYALNFKKTDAIKKVNLIHKTNKINSLKNIMGNKKLITVDIKSDVPLGCGFGLSGASALGTAISLNNLLRLGKNKRELGFLAHKAEVVNGTGLGDVCGQYNSKGFMIRYKGEDNLHAEKLKIKDKYIYYRVFGSLETKKIIRNADFKKKINKAGMAALKKVIELNKKGRITVDKLLKISREFTFDAELANKEVKKLIDNLDKKCINASMIMLGNAIFSNKNFTGAKKTKVYSK